MTSKETSPLSVRVRRSGSADGFDLKNRLTVAALGSFKGRIADTRIIAHARGRARGRKKEAVRVPANTHGLPRESASRLLPEALAVLVRRDESLDHLGLDEVAAE